MGQKRPVDPEGPGGRRSRLPFVLVLAMLATVSCRPEIVVRLATVVYHDGSLERRVEVVGRTSDREQPTEEDWLAESVGLDLSEPDAWARVEREPGRLRAEGFFVSADELPPVLSLQTGTSEKRSRIRTRVEIDDRVVLKRWIYSESHGDPYTRAEVAAALDALIELAVKALHDELNAQFGGEVDPAPAEELMREKGRALASALLSVGRAQPGWEHLDERAENWTRVLTQNGVPAVAVQEPFDYWSEQLPALLSWARDEVASVLTLDDAPLDPHELTFWPLGDDYEVQAMEIAERVWGSEDELFELVEPHLGPLLGYYGGEDVPRFLFEVRASVPGVLLATNGTPDGESVVWIFREQDLTLGERVLRVESVEAQTEPLISLGARRDLDRTQLLQLADLLWTRDPEGGLSDVLRRAVHLGRLDLLRDENEVPDELEHVARELADILDPSIPAREPL